jgi:hypothetical protein
VLYGPARYEGFKSEVKEHVGIVALRFDTTIKKINGNENFNYERIIRVKSSEESL